ncbi:MAG: hypothetical protein PHN88_05095 [Ignavibacteria bacterium]|nr:hypothetical protein [Ignavibacteria bacterium]
MKIFFAMLFSFLTFSFCFSQNYHAFNENDWIGTWKGSLKILYPSSVQEVTMTLEIAKTSAPGKYSWKTTYGESPKTLEKNYFLYAKDADKGQWILDEDNTIFLDVYLTDNVMYTLFEVKGSLLNSIYTLDGNNIVFEVLSSKSDTPRISGNGDDEVKSYPVFVIQKAKLTK